MKKSEEEEDKKNNQQDVIEVGDPDEQAVDTENLEKIFVHEILSVLTSIFQKNELKQDNE